MFCFVFLLTFLKSNIIILMNIIESVLVALFMFFCHMLDLLGDILI